MADKTTTFAEALCLHLERLDRAWRKVVACHADAEHCNDGSRDYREAKAELESAERAMWRLKAAIADLRN